MSKYDVVITVRGRGSCIGESTGSLAQARRRFRWEQKQGDDRIVDIVKAGKLIESTHPERKLA